MAEVHTEQSSPTLSVGVLLYGATALSCHVDASGLLVLMF